MNFVGESTVELVQSNASDDMVCMAAWVSFDQDKAERLQNENAKAGLINFLYKNRHMSPFEHGQFTFKVTTPLFVRSEHHRHRTQCLDGSTMISFANGKSKSIADHWEHWNLGVSDTMGRRRILPSVKNAKVVTYDENTHERLEGTVLDVIKGDPKEMFELVTSRGFKIIASADHKFLTTSGWKPLGELVVGEDHLHVRHKRLSEATTHKTATPWYLRTAINSWSHSQKELVIERDGELCSKCEENVGETIDHKIPVALSLKDALDVDNLRYICNDCDRTKINAEQQYADRKMSFITISPDIVVSVTPVGIRESYDLVIDEPWHNFLGNGIVTHNSYNEISGRYTKYDMRFYLPPDDRPLVQEGKPGQYRFVEGNSHQQEVVDTSLRRVVDVAVEEYERMLNEGIAKEVARMALPPNLMTSYYATVNPRNLMAFLDLRLDPTALHEIRTVAGTMEDIFKTQMPLTYKAWKEN